MQKKLGVTRTWDVKNIRELKHPRQLTTLRLLLFTRILYCRQIALNSTSQIEVGSNSTGDLILDPQNLENCVSSRVL